MMVSRVNNVNGNMRNGEYGRLCADINEWNQNRLDLFEISTPNENFDFFGVVRFYHQTNNITTHSKCIRISSSWTTEYILQLLMEKFRPDMKMLTNDIHCLYEVHSNGDERKLNNFDKPLNVQLGWGKDDRDGRFIFKLDKDNAKIPEQPFKRKLSKREKKQLKKQEKLEKINSNEPVLNGSVVVDSRMSIGSKGRVSIAESHFSEIPDTNLHRTISNPETLVKKRRQTKIERILRTLNEQSFLTPCVKMKLYVDPSISKTQPSVLNVSVYPTDTCVIILEKAVIEMGLNVAQVDEFVLLKCMKVSRNKVKMVMDMAHRPLSELVNWPGTMEKSCNKGEKTEAPSNNLKNVKFLIKRSIPTVVMEMERFTESSSFLLQTKYKSQHTVTLLELVLDPKFDIKKKDIKNAFVSFGRAIELGRGEHMIGAGRKLNMNASHQDSLDPNVITIDNGADIEPLHAYISVQDVIKIRPCQNSLIYVESTSISQDTLLQDETFICLGTKTIFKVFDCRNRISSSIDQMTRIMRDYQKKLFNSRVSVDEERSVRSASLSLKKGNPDEDSVRISNASKKLDSNYQEPCNDWRSVKKLPLSLEFGNAQNVINAMIWSPNLPSISYKHGPAYVFYLSCRYIIDTPDRFKNVNVELISFVDKITMSFASIVEKSMHYPHNLSFIVANVSEFLHFIKFDADLSDILPQRIILKLSQVLEKTFYYLVDQLQLKAESSMQDFLHDADDDVHNGQHENTAQLLDSLLQIFSTTMPMLRRCRINAALAIQLFSQLFYFINMWLFNRLVQPNSQSNLLCNRKWGLRLRRRIQHVEIWAEKQGLELAADCHLGLIIQTCNFLQARKSSDDDLAAIAASSFRINSMQMKAICCLYQPSQGETPLSTHIIQKLVSNARINSDHIVVSENRELQLLEPKRLPLPFMLPNDGYSCSTIKGVPSVMMSFFKKYSMERLFKISVNESSSGKWNIFMTENDSNAEKNTPNQADGANVTISDETHRGKEATNVYNNEHQCYLITIKKVNNSLGLSIVSAKSENSQYRGIYIKSVVPGGTASVDGRLHEGDQLIEVDGTCLINVSQEYAADRMKHSKNCVTLKILKNAAKLHGLESIFKSGSPPVLTNRIDNSGLMRLDARSQSVGFLEPQPILKQSPIIKKKDIFSPRDVEIRRKSLDAKMFGSSPIQGATLGSPKKMNNVSFGNNSHKSNTMTRLDNTMEKRVNYTPKKESRNSSYSQESVLKSVVAKRLSKNNIENSTLDLSNTDMSRFNENRRSLCRNVVEKTPVQRAVDFNISTRSRSEYNMQNATLDRHNEIHLESFGKEQQLDQNVDVHVGHQSKNDILEQHNEMQLERFEKEPQLGQKFNNHVVHQSINETYNASKSNELNEQFKLDVVNNHTSDMCPSPKNSFRVESSSMSSKIAPSNDSQSDSTAFSNSVPTYSDTLPLKKMSFTAPESFTKTVISASMSQSESLEKDTNKPKFSKEYLMELEELEQLNVAMRGSLPPIMKKRLLKMQTEYQEYRNNIDVSDQFENNKTDENINFSLTDKNYQDTYCSSKDSSISKSSKSFQQPEIQTMKPATFSTFKRFQENRPLKKFYRDTKLDDMSHIQNESVVQSGVVGTQEIYNDPRERIIAQKKLSIQSNNANVDGSINDQVAYEKMSFCDKIKIFNNSKDTNIINLPKCSKAQRLLERNNS